MSASLSKCINLLRSEIETAFPTYFSVKDSRLYSLSVNLHLDQVPAIPQLPAPFLIWGRPDRNHYRIGLGTTLQYKTSGKERFQKLQCYFDKIRSNWHHDCLTELPYQAGAFCAFAFDEDDVLVHVVDDEDVLRVRHRGLLNVGGGRGREGQADSGPR